MEGRGGSAQAFVPSTGERLLGELVVEQSLNGVQHGVVGSRPGFARRRRRPRRRPRRRRHFGRVSGTRRTAVALLAAGTFRPAAVVFVRVAASIAVRRPVSVRVVRLPNAVIAVPFVVRVHAIHVLVATSPGRHAPFAGRAPDPRAPLLRTFARQAVLVYDDPTEPAGSRG